MNKKLLLVVILVFLLGGVFIVIKNLRSNNLNKNTEKQVPPKVITVRSDAETIAKEFLSKQTYKDQYLENPISAETYPEFWNVWFATKDPKKKPNRGLVQINRATGVAEWKELQ